MTDIVVPPPAILPAEFPALGDSNFNAKAYTWGDTEPTVVQRVGEMAQATMTNATAAHERAVAADNSATAASNSATAASEDATRLATLDALWLGAFAADPTTGRHGAPLVAGNAYINTATGVLRAYNGSAWVQGLYGDTGLVAMSNVVGLQDALDAKLTALVSADVVTSNTTATAGKVYDINTSGGAFTLTLPAIPAVGARVGVNDVGRQCNVFPLTLARNGQLIEGLAEDCTVNLIFRGIVEFRGGAFGWVFI